MLILFQPLLFIPLGSKDYRVDPFVFIYLLAEKYVLVQQDILILTLLPPKLPSH